MNPIQTVHTAQGIGANVDGAPIIGWWEGNDAIMFETAEDEGKHIIGAEGSSVWSQFADRSGIITLKLLPASPSNDMLYAKKERQESGVPLPFDTNFFDLGGGEAGVATDCYILKAPTTSLGKEATVREWKISTSNLRRS